MKVLLNSWVARMASNRMLKRLIGAAGLIGVGLMSWTLWPLPVGQTGFTLSSLYIERGHVNLEWPLTLRRGDADPIHLSVDTTGMLVEIESDDGPVQISLSDLGADFNPVIEAYLELSGSEVSPPGAIRASFSPGQRVDFGWLVKSRSMGMLEGRLWLYLELVPTTSEENVTVRYPVLARPLEIESRAILGLGVGFARWLGGILILLSVWLLWMTWKT